MADEKKKPGRPPKSSQETLESDASNTESVLEITEPVTETLKTRPESKTLNNVDMETSKQNVSDVEIYGNPDKWLCLSKASSKTQGWVKSTKAMDVPGYGCLVQVSEQLGERLATSIVAIQGVGVYTSKYGGYRLCGHNQRNELEV